MFTQRCSWFLQILKSNPTQGAGLHFLVVFKIIEIWILTFTLGNQQALTRKIFRAYLIANFLSTFYEHSEQHIISRCSFHLCFSVFLFFYCCFVFFQFGSINYEKDFQGVSYSKFFKYFLWAFWTTHNFTLFISPLFFCFFVFLLLFCFFSIWFDKLNWEGV